MRRHRSGLREMPVVATAILLILSGCSGAGNGSGTSGTTPDTAPPTTASGSSAPPAPSATSTTAAAWPLWGVGETVLVTADDGVYQISAEGDVSLLLDGPVAYAVDDTEGGLLFQVARGRNWDETDPWSTIVWWIPRGTSTPQELLVPTPGTDHSLSLHDAYVTDDGFAVLYVRHEEGVTPSEMTDRLRRFEVPARKVTELYSQGAFEQGFGHVSSNGELIAGVWYEQVGSGCFVYDLDGQPTDLVPEEAGDPISDDYVSGCRLSPSGDRFSFFTEQYEANELASITLHVWDLNADTETTRFVVLGSADIPSDLDVSATRAVATFAGENKRRTLVFNLEAPDADPIALSVAGKGFFVDSPIDIEAPVASPDLTADY